MLFNTPEFIFIFLPIALVGYFLLNKYLNYSYVIPWLTLTSICFYAFSSTNSLFLLCVSLIINFLIGKKLQNLSSDTRKKSSVEIRKFLFLIGLAANIIFLVFYKYINFIISNITILNNSHFVFPKFFLPLAISFYTFQQIAFLVDCYKCKINQKINFLHYSFFVLFFPQLIAGPILRYSELSPQLEKENIKGIDFSNVSKGAYIFGIGLFKKVVIANYFSVFANAGFDSNNTISFIEAWTASLSYTFQIYYDFSGYTDMAIGAALLFNIRLPINFNSPYKAINIQEFWQRWHITLSRWLRDYLYIPLGGNRKGFFRTLTNLLLTFLIAGIWHGAGWTFIIWGLLHGLALISLRIWRRSNLKISKTVGWFCTFFFINITWVFFRSENLTDAFRILNGMFFTEIDFETQVLNLHLLMYEFSPIAPWRDYFGSRTTTILSCSFILIYSLITFFMPNSMKIIQFIPYRGMFVFKTTLLGAMILASLLFFSFLTFLGNTPQGEFIYFNF